ncbi:MAG TPA: FMN-binding negative transcriptional regulator, partial [Chitinophagaceae bacterium]|nr:FMN-binding negative transcriptional regulator [Chitinophagaceae bacterium]
GCLQFLPELALESLLQEVSMHFESDNAAAAPVYENLPAAYRERLLKSIIGFEIKIESLEHVFKLSQNRDEESYDHIISHLGKATGDGEELADYMRKCRSQLFKGSDF